MEVIVFFVVKTVVFVWLLRLGLDWLKENGFLSANRRNREYFDPQPLYRDVEARTYESPRLKGHISCRSEDERILVAAAEILRRRN